MFRQKKCLQLETRLSRARQVMSREDDENKAIRAKIDELRRLIMMQVNMRGCVHVYGRQGEMDYRTGSSKSGTRLSSTQHPDNQA